MLAFTFITTKMTIYQRMKMRVTTDKRSSSFFFEYAGDLHIIVLRSSLSLYNAGRGHAKREVVLIDE